MTDDDDDSFWLEGCSGGCMILVLSAALVLALFWSFIWTAVL